MGRRKLKMELIPKKGSRMLTFQKRKEGLKKKLDELKTLCDVDASMIIYGPDSGADSEIYPNDVFATCRIIDNYKSKKGDPTKCKTFGLKDFFEERQRKALEELAKIRKERSEAKYPTWHHKLEEEKDPLVLRDFAHKLSAKSQYLKSIIQSIKNNNNNNNNEIPLDRNYPQQYNHGHGVFMNSTGEGAMVCYNQVAAPPYAVVNRNVEYLLPPLPDEYQSQGEAYVMENEEGSQYLLPFHY